MGGMGVAEVVGGEEATLKLGESAWGAEEVPGVALSSKPSIRLKSEIPWLFLMCLTK